VAVHQAIDAVLPLRTISNQLDPLTSQSNFQLYADYKCCLCVGVNVLVSSSERRSNKLTKKLDVGQILIYMHFDNILRGYERSHVFSFIFISYLLIIRNQHSNESAYS
jgi:hypothetical protein